MAVPDTPRPTPIDTDGWPRVDHWRHFRSTVPCSFSLVVDLDATRLRTAVRSAGLRAFPAQLWALATAVNAHREFRMAETADGGPAAWDELHPSFTVFDPATETFCGVWVPYDADVRRFSDAVVATADEFRGSPRIDPQDDAPPNTFDVSALPWLSFTSFALHLPYGHQHLLPIFHLGGYRTEGGRTLLPLAVQIHHAAADGFHVSRLVADVQRVFDDEDVWYATTYDGRGEGTP